MKKAGKRLLYASVSAVFWIALWAIAAALVDRALVLPSPLQVLRTLGTLLPQPAFYLTVGNTLLHTLLGFAAGACAAVPLAVLCCRFSAVDILFRPMMTVIRATPVASFIILALMLLGKAQVPGLICFLMVMPVVFGSVRTGIETRDEKLLTVTRVFGFSPWRRLTAYSIPTLLPSFASGCRTALGLAWKAGVAAEVLCTPHATIGKSLYEAKLYLNTDAVFAWTLVIIVLSLLLEGLMGQLFTRLERRDGGAAA